MESLVHVTEHPGDCIGDTTSLHDPQQLAVSKFVAISIDQANHVPELHQTDVSPKIDEFLQPRFAEQMEHSEEELIYWAETGNAHPGHVGNGLLDRIRKRFLDRDVKGTLRPGQAVGDIDVDYPSPRLIDFARKLGQVVAVQAAADFFATGILRPTEERAEPELLHPTHHCFAIRRRDHEIDVIHVPRAETAVERRFKSHAFSDHKVDTVTGEPLGHADCFATKHIDLRAIPLQG